MQRAWQARDDAASSLKWHTENVENHVKSLAAATQNAREAGVKFAEASRDVVRLEMKYGVTG